jgi:hypothetical protein
MRWQELADGEYIVLVGVVVRGKAGAVFKLTPKQFGMIFESLQATSDSRGSEKRQATRMEVQTKLALASLANGSVGRCYSGLSRDVSASGLGVFQHTAAAGGDKFLACFPCGKEGELVLTCAVTFCRPMADGLFGIGAQFEGVAPAAVVADLNRLRTSEIERIRASVLG